VNRLDQKQNKDCSSGAKREEWRKEEVYHKKKSKVVCKGRADSRRRIQDFPCIHFFRDPMRGRTPLCYSFLVSDVAASSVLLFGKTNTPGLGFASCAATRV
jgi:hypothetical protein